MLCRASLAAMLASGSCSLQAKIGTHAACPDMKTTNFIVKLEIDPFGRYHPMLMAQDQNDRAFNPKAHR